MSRRLNGLLADLRWYVFPIWSSRKTINCDIEEKWLPTVEKMFSLLLNQCVADSSQPKIEATDPGIRGSNLDQWEDIVALTSNKERSLWGTPFSPWIICAVQRKYKISILFRCWLEASMNLCLTLSSTIKMETPSLVKGQLKQPFLGLSASRLPLGMLQHWLKQPCFVVHCSAGRCVQGEI